MADKYLNNTGLQYYHNRLKTLFADKGDFNDLAEDVASLIAEGGEPNVIETISVNGTNVPPTNKNVALTIPTATSDLTNNGDGESPFATEDYVDENGGKIDVIKVNGTTQTITNKTVDITMPTKVSDLTNDSNFQSATDVTSAITTALANSGDPYMPESDIQQLIDDELAGITGVEFEVVQTLPQPSGQKGVIYLVNKDGAGQDVYDEYIWVEPTGQTPHYEKIGTTNIDLSDYWAKSELVAITTAEIDTIVGA